ncbi:MAG: hypothetical protein H6Q41_1616 [Deltaproteobacteria bacterium]|nr:hypothetical protein [Deltaproteobacteria bacterium]
MESVPPTILLYERALNLSKASWAKVEASVILCPNELFFVVWTIKPARANNAIDNMTIAISTSTSEKPFGILGILDGVNVSSPKNEFELVVAKPVPMDSDYGRGKMVVWNCIIV